MKRKKQGYDDRLDESLGMRHRGPHKQSFKDRRDESKGEMKRMGINPFGGDREMRDAYHNHMASAHHRFMANKYRKKMFAKN